MKTKTTDERFWSHVDKSGDCWLWTGSKRNKGYGAFCWASNNLVVQGRAHRYSWEQRNGTIPDGMCVLHRCDTPACVNPDHLFLGSKADNNHDMCAKGRHVSGGTHCGNSYSGSAKYPTGEAHHNAKLTLAGVAEIRKDRLAGMSFSTLAKKYRISQTAVFRAAKGITWKSK